MAGSTVRHLSQRQLADRWQLSERTLERWRCLGKGPPFVKLSGRTAYLLEDILAFEKDGKQETGT